MNQSIKDAKEQICLISEQLLPNYMGAVTLAGSVKKIHFIVTPQMDPAAELLKKVFEARKITVNKHTLSKPRPKELFDLLEDIRSQIEDEVIINVTGGTKVMSITAVEWANMNSILPFYVDTEAEELLYMTERMEVQTIDVRLKVMDILEAQGYHFGKDKPPRISPISNRDVLKEIVAFCLRNPDILRSVNGSLYQGDRLNLFCKCTNSRDKELFKLFEQAGMASCSEDYVSFSNKDAMDWCHGKWLESYTHSVLYHMKSKGSLDDWSMDFEFFASKQDADNSQNSRYQQKNFHNEFDAAFTSHNRLYVIECKTSNFENDVDNSKSTDLIYKLDWLTGRAGGSFATGIFVSINDVKGNVLARMKKRNRAVICGKDLKNLESKLESLIVRK